MLNPSFVRQGPCHFALRKAIEDELDRLEKEKILYKVDHSDWAAPIVPVPQKNGQLRICGDYKVTVNPVIDVNKYPLPRPEDMLAALAGGEKFTKLDLTNAYLQMVLDPECRKFVTINTHRGLYEYTRLPFGISSAPARFQKTMDIILQGLPKVLCYIDDILVTGKDDDDHYANLENVLKRLKDYGLKLKTEKCAFLRESIEYLGHKIDSKGVHATTEKLKGDAPRPINLQQLRSFLGLIHYYGKFIPNLATLLHPLNELLHKGTRWDWSNKCEQSFKAAKEALLSTSVLAHYDPSLPLKLAGDASPYGIGAVISHTMPDGSERPIAFASRTLSNSERNYAQIEREALSLIFGVKRFHSYLYGRTTDHKPLTAILGPKQGIPPLAAARLQRWAILLSAYTYDIEFKPTTAHSNRQPFEMA